MSKQKINDYERRLTAVHLYEQLGNKSEVARVMGIFPSQVQDWVRRYKIGGPSALFPVTGHPIYDPEIRIAIVEDIRNKNISLREASAVFGISPKALGRWIREVEEHGFTALFDRIPSNKVPGMVTKKKKRNEPLTELEQLREENLRLRAELDLIKKVDALVAERCKPTRKSVRKPSKD